MASREAAAGIAARMNATIVHRGPDDAGVWTHNAAAIAMRRLSIIDLAGGHQPMTTDDGVAIVFNGEIYNYRELRDELQRAGYAFRTNSDTEVILDLYHHAGLEGLKRLDGMFAICLVDTRTGEAHLVRDRVGIKPLYFGERDKRFYFGSEIKAILAGMESRPPVNDMALFHYLTLRYVPGPETIWKGIRKLNPGESLTYRFADNTWRVVPYWKLRFDSEPLDPTHDYEAEFEKLFLASVKSHLLAADVPVGILLSGGLDSSSVAAAAAELGIRGLHTFSVAFSDGGQFSELEFARQTAKYIDAQHHEVVIGQREFIDFFDDFVWYTDEPLADLASIPLYYVSRLAREHVKVVLSGEGADEVLAGYNFHEAARAADRRRRLLAHVPRFAFRAASWCFPESQARTLRIMAREGWSRYPKAWAASMTSDWTDEEKAVVWRGSDTPTLSTELIRSWYDLCRSDSPLDMLQETSSRQWLVEDLLMKADKMTMATSLELRVPFLAYRMVEWAQRLPREWKVGGPKVGYASKRILRRFAATRIPETIITRPKQGFPVPAYIWLRGDTAAWAEARLFNGGSPLVQWLDLAAARPQLQAARTGNNAAAHKIWNLLVLDAWARRWL